MFCSFFLKTKYFKISAILYSKTFYKLGIESAEILFRYLFGMRQDIKENKLKRLIYREYVNFSV